MKHSHRPPRHRSGSFSKAPHKGGEDRFEGREQRPERKFHKPGRQKPDFRSKDRSSSEQSGEGRFEGREDRPERKFHKPGRQKPDFRSKDRSSSEQSGEGRFEGREDRPERKFHKHDRKPDFKARDRNFPEKRGEGRFESREDRPERKFHKHNGKPDFKNRDRDFSKEGGEGRSETRAERKERKFQQYGRKPDFRSKDRGFPDKSREERGERKFRKHDRKPDFKARDRNLSEKPVPSDSSPQPAREGVLLWGLHAVREAWLNQKRRCIRLWITENALQAFDPVRTEAKNALINRPDPKKVERSELDRLAPPGSVHQGLVLEVAPLPEPGLHEVIAGETPPDLVILLDQVTDPHNVGAIARSAAALGAGAIIMTERNAPGLTGVLAKAASGAIEHVPLLHIVNLARAIEELQQAGYWCIGLAEEGDKDLSACDMSSRTALVLGAEGEGLRQLTRKKCDQLARLPTGGPIGSLNVSNAAAIALYEARRQKKKFS